MEISILFSETDDKIPISQLFYGQNRRICLTNRPTQCNRVLRPRTLLFCKQLVVTHFSMRNAISCDFPTATNYLTKNATSSVRKSFSSSARLLQSPAQSSAVRRYADGAMRLIGANGDEVVQVTMTTHQSEGPDQVVRVAYDADHVPVQEDHVRKLGMDFFTCMRRRKTGDCKYCVDENCSSAINYCNKNSAKLKDKTM